MPLVRFHPWTTRRISPCSKASQVLVVDDNHNAAEALTANLFHEDFECRTAFSGHQAIETAKNWIPHIIVMDISMPDCTGFDAARALRGDHRTAGIVILAFAALDETEVRGQAGERDFDGYCQKGQPPTSLVRLIYMFVNGEHGKPTTHTHLGCLFQFPHLMRHIYVMRTPKSQLPSVVRRMRAGQMLMASEDILSVARQLGISAASAKRYKAILEAGGLEALEAMGVGGRKSALDAKALEWVANSLRGSPVTFGFNSDQWTDGRLRSVIRNRFGVDFSRVYVRLIMIDLGFADRLTPRRGQQHRRNRRSSHRLRSHGLLRRYGTLREAKGSTPIGGQTSG